VTSGTLITSAIQTDFQVYTLASVSGENPLPVELLWFNAVPDQHVVQLAWATATEQGSDHFTIERSSNAESWTAIAQVDAAGDSQDEQDYATIDPSPLSGLSYYRLAQTDLDGTTTWSNAVSVMMGVPGERPLTVFTHDGVVNALHDFAAGSMVEVLDLSGRSIMRDRTIEAGITRIVATGLPNGVYVLRMSDDSRTVAERFLY
jgi:hypothetical protein